MFKRITIVGTGLIGTSVALALRRSGFAGELIGIDRDEAERSQALRTLAFSEVTLDRLGEGLASRDSDVVVLATPVLGILDWMERLSEVLGKDQLLTDVGSTKETIAEHARALYNKPGRAHFLPGHPMAGKERGGAELGDAELFKNAMWLFTPVSEPTPAAEEWRRCVQRMGARTRDLDPARHDELLAWVSHLPQMLSTALAATLEERFGDDAEIAAIGGRALRETTRLGASPYSMWRDVAMTNTAAVGEALQALEQELQHIRENLRTPELREEFARANRFRARRD